MARLNLTRVIFVLAMTCSVLVQAGFFGGEEEERKPRRRRRDEPPMEDTAEQYNPSYQERVEAKRQQHEREHNGGREDPRNEEREHPRDRAKKQKPRKKAKNRDQMMSDDYTREIIRDEQIEETHTPEENLDGYLTDDDINKIWAEHMHDFVPEEMSNFIVESKSTEALFEYIGHWEPTTIKGAYYVMGGSPDKTISCIVYDAKRQIVYKRKGSAQGILMFDTTGPGEYTFIFQNMDSGIDLTVTLALHTYEETIEEISYDLTESGERVEITPQSKEEMKQDVLGGEENHAATEDEIADVRRMLREIQVQTKQMQSETKLSMMRQDSHNNSVLESQDWNFYFMLIECACFIGILGFQSHHIKAMLDNKLIM